MRNPRRVWLGWSLWACCVALALATGVASGAGLAGWLPSLATLGMPTIGALIIWRRPGNAIGWLFCALGIAWVLAFFPQTYLTAGPKEARAWTIHIGDTAPVAAGVIHTDFQKGFIKAEVVSYDDLIACGSMAEAKAKGKVRMEGKEYVMHDGDVVEFRFNV